MKTYSMICKGPSEKMSLEYSERLTQWIYRDPDSTKARIFQEKDILF